MKSLLVTNKYQRTNGIVKNFYIHFTKSPWRILDEHRYMQTCVCIYIYIWGQRNEIDKIIRSSQLASSREEMERSTIELECKWIYWILDACAELRMVWCGPCMHAVHARGSSGHIVWLRSEADPIWERTIVLGW